MVVLVEFRLGLIEVVGVDVVVCVSIGNGRGVSYVDNNIVVVSLWMCG